MSMMLQKTRARLIIVLELDNSGLNYYNIIIRLDNNSLLCGNNAQTPLTIVRIFPDIAQALPETGRIPLHPARIPLNPALISSTPAP